MTSVMKQTQWIDAAVFGLAGAGCGALILGGSGWGWQLTLAYGAACVLAARLLWPWLPRGGRRTWPRAALAGAAVETVAHPLAFYLLICVYYAAGVRGSLGDPTLNPLQGLVAAFAYAAWSWLIAGWVTASVGALVGLLLNATRRRVAS